jgi:hypothetical protein
MHLNDLDVIIRTVLERETPESTRGKCPEVLRSETAEVEEDRIAVAEIRESRNSRTAVILVEIPEMFFPKGKSPSSLRN